MFRKMLICTNTLHHTETQVSFRAGICRAVPSSTWIQLDIHEKDTLRRAWYVRMTLICRSVRLLSLSLHTQDTLVSSSQLRAIWYVFEVASQENGNVSNTVVEVVWNESASIFDYDKVLHDKLLYYHDTSWPTRGAAMHVCCSSPFVARFLRPVSHTMTAFLHAWTDMIHI